MARTDKERKIAQNKKLLYKDFPELFMLNQNWNLEKVTISAHTASTSDIIQLNKENQACECIWFLVAKDNITIQLVKAKQTSHLAEQIQIIEYNSFANGAIIYIFKALFENSSNELSEKSVKSVTVFRSPKKSNFKILSSQIFQSLYEVRAAKNIPEPM